MLAVESADEGEDINEQGQNEDDFKCAEDAGRGEVASVEENPKENEENCKTDGTETEEDARDGGKTTPMHGDLLGRHARFGSGGFCRNGPLYGF